VSLRSTCLADGDRDGGDTVVRRRLAAVVLLILLLRWAASRSEDQGDGYREDTYGSNRRPCGVEFFPRYLQRFGGGELDDRP